MDTLSKIQAMLSKEYDLPMERLAPDQSLADLGIDSLTTIEFMFKLGFHSAENIINADASELLAVPDLDQETAEALQEVCEDLLEARATGKLWGQGGRSGAMQRLSAGEVKPVAAQG